MTCLTTHRRQIRPAARHDPRGIGRPVIQWTGQGAAVRRRTIMARSWSRYLLMRSGQNK